MIVNEVIGNIYTDDSKKWMSHSVDYLELEWYELNKRILRKHTLGNQEVGIQFEGGAASLADGDVLAEFEDMVIVIKVKADECMAIIASNNYELARMCYEIGNRHAPLFIDEHDDKRLLLPKDKPLQLLLEKMGFNPIIVKARLIKPLSAAKGHQHNHNHEY